MTVELRLEAKAKLSHKPGCGCSMCQDGTEVIKETHPADLGDFLGRVTAMISTWEAPGSPQEALSALSATRVLVKELGTLESFLEGALLGMMEEKTLTIGDQQVTKKRTANRTSWDHDGLLGEVRRRALEERQPTAEGEIENPLDAFLRLFKETASVSYWRMGALKQHNIDPYDYRTVEWGREKIVVEPVVGVGAQSDNGSGETSASGNSSEGGQERATNDE